MEMAQESIKKIFEGIYDVKNLYEGGCYEAYTDSVIYDFHFILRR